MSTYTNILNITNFNERSFSGLTTDTFRGVLNVPLNKIYKVNSLSATNVSTRNELTFFSVIVDPYNENGVWLAHELPIERSETIYVISKDSPIILHPRDKLFVVDSLGEVVRVRIEYTEMS